MTNTETQRVQLQGIGWHTAKPAAEVAVGDVLVWNYGYTSTVRGIERKGSFLVFTLESRDRAGNVLTSTRRKAAKTLLAFVTGKGRDVLL